MVDITGRGEITGRVYDLQTNQALNDVHVWIEELSFLDAYTDSSGIYFIKNVLPGSYQVYSQQKGFTL